VGGGKKKGEENEENEERRGSRRRRRRHLDRPGGDVAIAGVHPGEVAVAGRHQDLWYNYSKAGQGAAHVVELLGVLLAGVADVAAVVVRVDLPWEEAALVLRPPDVQRAAVWAGHSIIFPVVFLWRWIYQRRCRPALPARGCRPGQV
jgi:hypothetical protein